MNEMSFTAGEAPIKSYGSRMPTIAQLSWQKNAFDDF